MKASVKGGSVFRLSLPEALAGLAGLAAAIASIAGFIPGLYRDPMVVIAQAHGYDVGNLIVVAFLALGLVWSARGSVRGRLVLIGGLACLAYSYVTYAFLIVLNPATVLYIAVLGLAGWSVATGLLRLDGETVEGREQPRFLRPATGAFMLVLVVIFAATWLGQIGASVVSGHLPADLVAAGWPMNPVWVLDLGFVLPLIGLGGVRLLRRRAGGAPIAISVLVFLPLLSATILSMTVSMAIAGQALDMALVVIFGTIALVSTSLALAWLGSRRESRARRPSSPLWSPGRTS
jgi:hypothetical protein